MGWKRVITRLGIISKEQERSLLFVGHERAAFEQLSAVIDELKRRDSRLHTVLSSPDPEILIWLKERFPGLLVLPLPFANRISAEIYMRQLKVRAVAFVEPDHRYVSHYLLAALQRSAIGAVTVSGRSAAKLPQQGAVRQASEAVVLVGEKTHNNALPHGVTAMTATQMADRLGMMLARDLKALREANLLSRIMAALPAKLASSPRWRGIATWRIRRYSALPDLSTRLTTPKVIMCLGNGPSSEDPTLEAMPKDVLFRVNHSWLSRRYLADADVVFTGGRATMREVSGAIFGLQAPEAVNRLILARFYGPMMGRTEFFYVGDITSSLKDFEWGHLRPTNGASMLATAVALKPDKLIIAGIDLFLHPAGSYPGNCAAVNAYSPGHSRNSELDFLLKLFSGFSGEIVIIGEILRKAWEVHQSGGAKIH